MSYIVSGERIPDNCKDCKLFDRWGKECPFYSITKDYYPEKCFVRCPLEEVEEQEMNKEEPDYKKRMKQEYKELKEKYDNLHKFIVKYEAGTLDFEPDCSLELLKRQAKAMGDYLFALEARAEISKVNLDAKEEPD